MLAESKPVTPKTELRISGVEKRYGDFIALRSTDLVVRQGEFLTLLGPSGSGKTTLLMMIAGLAHPTSGEIWIDGKLATSAPPHLRDIGLVFQNYALFPHLSVYENVAFPLRMRRMPATEIAANVERVLKIVNLADMGQRLPKELSGGQQQRVALARCAVYGPSIILMDEPLGALDKKLRDTMQIEIKRLHRALGSTIIYVTHDQGEAMTMSDRICLMRNGGIEQIGTPDELYFRPKSRFVGDFLGGTNFVPAKVAGADGRQMLLTCPMEVRVQRPERAVGAFEANDDVEFMVRPQYITVAKQPIEGMNALSATVTDTIITGLNTECHATLENGHPICAVSLTTQSERLYQTGDKVLMCWRPEHTTVFHGAREQ